MYAWKSSGWSLLTSLADVTHSAAGNSTFSADFLSLSSPNLNAYKSIYLNSKPLAPVFVRAFLILNVPHSFPIHAHMHKARFLDQKMLIIFQYNTTE